jgi:DNA mismatch repair protein MutS
MRQHPSTPDPDHEASMTTGASHDQPHTAEEPAAISLLWPSGAPRGSSAGQQLPADSAADLQMTAIVQVLADGGGRSSRRDHRERLVRQTLTELCTDSGVIAYRQEVVDELVNDPPLRERLARILPDLEALSEISPSNRFQPPDEGAVQRIARQLGDYELFVDVARQLERALEAAPLRSRALQALREYVHVTTGTPTFQALEAELPALRATLSQARSVTIGVNLSPDLVPESATILALSAERVEGARTLLDRLLGGLDVGRGITPLQRGSAVRSNGFTGEPNRLTRDLNTLLEGVAAPVARALDRYAAVPTGALAGIGPELALLLNGALLVERLGRAGLAMCRPEILPPDERVSDLRDSYDISLALRLYRPDGTPTSGLASVASGSSADAAGIVTNVMTFDDESARVWILTGPNRAGKTTYTRALGLVHVLFQAGLYVPGSSARLSPVDAIYTHFPSHEQAQPGMGRLDEEAERLAGIFQRATPRSLVLLNETLAGTAASEAEGLARDAVRGLRLLGARAVYVTHLHDLARAVNEINATTPGASLVGSLVADADDEDEHDSAIGPQHRRTFRIHPGVPLGRSFASEIARRHGISFSQLTALLRDRGISDAVAATTDVETEPLGGDVTR